MTFLSSHALAASCPVNKDIQAEGDRATDSRAFHENYIGHKGYKSHSVTAEGARWNMVIHVNLPTDNPSQVDSRWSYSSDTFMAVSCIMIPPELACCHRRRLRSYLEVCPWNRVTGPWVSRWEELLIDTSTVAPCRRPIHSPDRTMTQH